MFQLARIRRVAVLGQSPDPDLLALFRAWFEQVEFAPAPGGLADWTAALWQTPPDGLLVDTESLRLADLQAIEAWSAAHPDHPVLLVTGDRGLVGLESSVGRPSVKVLPQPWTVAALRALLGMATPIPVAPPAKESPPGSEVETSSQSEAVRGEVRNLASASSSGRPVPGTRPVIPARPSNHSTSSAQNHEFSSEFLEGMVERFRDPLASLSGYLQLIETRAEGPAELVQPALEAAREMDGLLEVLHLAAGQRPLHPSRLSAEQLAIDALKDAQKHGIEVSLDRREDFHVRADARLAQAALLVARTLLDRFGGGSGLALTCKAIEDGATLYWDVVDAPLAPESSAVAPPPFLEQLLARLAEKLGADSMIQSSHGGAVPRRAGLIWPSRLLVTALL